VRGRAACLNIIRVTRPHHLRIFCFAQIRGTAPHPPRFARRPLPQAGEVNMRHHSRGAFFVRVRAMGTAGARPSPRGRSSSERSGSGWPDASRSAAAHKQKKNKNKAGGTPADAKYNLRTIRVRRAPGGARCAYRRSTAALAAANQRRRSAPDALPGTWLRGGGWPPPPVPVQRSNRRPVIMPAGRYPEAARVRR
jgi:hypothetical protein